MAETSAINSTATATPSTDAKEKLALDSEDFMQLMITELTNQDPFEPMKNQDLVNQMSTIQQLQSNQDMAKSFESLMDKYDSVLQRQELSTATGMIGELVSGTATNGETAVGKIISVSMDGESIVFELDSGHKVKLDDIHRLGGNTGQDIVGELVMGYTSDGDQVVGKVSSVAANGDDITLHVQSADAKETVAVSLRNASIIKLDTAAQADQLISKTVTGLGDVMGVVESVEWSGDKIILNILNQKNEFEQLSLDAITGIF